MSEFIILDSSGSFTCPQKYHRLLFPKEKKRRMIFLDAESLRCGDCDELMGFSMFYVLYVEKQE
jgi:hypothetical protein